MTAIRNQAQQLMGSAFDPDEWNNEAARTRVLDGLIDQVLLRQASDNAGMRVSDNQLAQVIRSLPAFADANGEFSTAMYESVILRSGMSAQTFQFRLRRDLLSQQMQDGIASSAFVTPKEAIAVERLRLQQRDINLVRVPAVVAADTPEPTDSEISAFYDSHAEQFQLPERVAIEYLRLTMNDLASAVEIDDAALEKYFEDNKANYSIGEERDASHILLEVPEGAADDEDAAVRAKAEALLTRINAGEDFATLASENSDDAGSASAGGELGAFGRGVMDPAFEEAAFAAAAGDVVGPVRTPFGYHLIKVNEIHPERGPEFAEVRSDIEQAYRRQQAEDIYFGKADQFTNLVYEHPETLEVAASQLGMTVERTELLSAAELRARFGTKVADVAFAPEVMLEGLNSDPVDVGDGDSIALRVVEHVDAAVRPLDEVRADVLAALKADIARDQARSRGQELLQAMQQGKSLADVAVEQGLDVEAHANSTRESIGLDPAIIERVFAVHVEHVDDVENVGVELANGDYVVATVANVRNAGSEMLTDQAVSNTARMLATVNAQNDWARFVAGLRETAEIETFPENI
ncbi:MAG: peptidyl-prolyl cis-trans isomerase [Gammaproteobacteria bacterium]|nr:peptidyl-prolyl cis-trans isomerase [Gammaproteobacteria bacterium]